MKIIAQIIGLLAFFFSLFAYHKNQKKKILKNMILSNALKLIHYLLLGAHSGLLTKILSIIRDVFIIEKEKHKTLDSNLFLILFIIFYLIIAVISYQDILTLFPIIAAMIYLVPIWNGSTKTLKKTALFTYVLWLVYDISIFSISGIIEHLILIISTFLALITPYFKKN